MPQNKDDSIRVLEEAVEGLTYPSESDELFDVVNWAGRGFGSARDALLAHVDRQRRIEQVEFDSFFRQLDSAENAADYRDLQRAVATALGDPAVFRVGAGEVRVDVYIIGHLGNGWGGLHTISVET